MRSMIFSSASTAMSKSLPCEINTSRPSEAETSVNSSVTSLVSSTTTPLPASPVPKLMSKPPDESKRAKTKATVILTNVVMIVCFYDCYLMM